MSWHATLFLWDIHERNTPAHVPGYISGARRPLRACVNSSFKNRLYKPWIHQKPRVTFFPVVFFFIHQLSNSHLYCKGGVHLHSTPTSCLACEEVYRSLLPFRTSFIPRCRVGIQQDDGIAECPTVTVLSMSFFVHDAAVQGSLHPA